MGRRMKKITASVLCLFFVVCCSCGVADVEMEKENTTELVFEAENESPDCIKERFPPAIIKEVKPESSEPKLQPTVQPEELTAILTKSGFSYGELSCEQLITVCADGTDARITLWESDSGAWSQVYDEMPGKVGRNGVSAKKEEGDGKTPVGLFGITLAFGTSDLTDLGLPYRRITEESYWVDDSNSIFYNQWVEGTEQKDWNSAEHMIDYSASYAQGFVIDYNMSPVVPGAGSAIFFHCGDRPTSGCVATSRDNVQKILLWLQSTKSPSILLVNIIETTIDISKTPTPRWNPVLESSTA